MKQHVRAVAYGNAAECRALGEMLRTAQLLPGHTHEYHAMDDLEEFEAALVDLEPTVAIVLADGEGGLECVRLSRTRRPNLPVFWFSDDHEYGMQSYRLDCAYFSTKPATPEKLRNAVSRCAHVGIRIATV